MVLFVHTYEIFAHQNWSVNCTSWEFSFKAYINFTASWDTSIPTFVFKDVHSFELVDTECIVSFGREELEFGNVHTFVLNEVMKLLASGVT